MKLHKKQAIGVKLESTQGSAVVPSTSTDYLLIDDFDPITDKELLQRDYRRASLDTLAHVIGKRFCKVSFNVEMKGSGTRGDNTIAGYAGLDALLQACGMTSVAVGSTSITYAVTSAPASANFFSPGKSVTIEGYKDGLKWIISGAVGLAKFSIDSGKFGMWSFEMWGAYADPTDVAVPTPTIVVVQPPIFQSATISIKTFAAVLSKFSFDLGNKISVRDDAASVNSIKGFVITSREPKGSAQVEAESVATQNFYNKMITSDESQTQIIYGATSGNIHSLTFPKTQYNEVKPQKRDDFLDFQLELQINQNTGDDCFTYLQT